MGFKWRNLSTKIEELMIRSRWFHPPTLQSSIIFSVVNKQCSPLFASKYLRTIAICPIHEDKKS